MFDPVLYLLEGKKTLKAIYGFSSPTTLFKQRPFKGSTLKCNLQQNAQLGPGTWFPKKTRPNWLDPPNCVGNPGGRLNMFLPV